MGILERGKNGTSRVRTWNEVTGKNHERQTYPN
jgi:hypothetical protein